MKPERDEAWEERRNVASAEEARHAIEGLTDADFAKLMLIAGSFARARIRGSVVAPEDLLQEALAKTLDGRRAWNRSVSILRHIDRVMESDAGHIAESRAAHAPAPMPEGADEPTSRVLDPSLRIAAQDELDDLLSLFVGDEEALNVIHLRGDGFSASEIQQQLGISKTNYETVTKRIRRRVAKRLSEGDPRS